MPRFDPGRVAKSFRIRVPGKNGESSIKLLGEHNPRQFVGERQGREGKFLCGAPAESLRKPVRAAAEKHNFARTSVTRFAQPLRKL
jgi:hypothetical protein